MNETIKRNLATAKRGKRKLAHRRKIQAWAVANGIALDNPQLAQLYYNSGRGIPFTDAQLARMIAEVSGKKTWKIAIKVLLIQGSTAVIILSLIWFTFVLHGNDVTKWLHSIA